MVEGRRRRARSLGPPRRVRRSAQFNKTVKYSASESADDETFALLKAMLAAKKNMTKFAAPEAAADDETLLLLKAMLMAKKNATRKWDAPEAAEDEFLLAALKAKVRAGWWWWWRGRGRGRGRGERRSFPPSTQLAAKNMTKKWDAPEAADDEFLMSALLAKVGHKVAARGRPASARARACARAAPLRRPRPFHIARALTPIPSPPPDRGQEGQGAQEHDGGRRARRHCRDGGRRRRGC